MTFGNSWFLLVGCILVYSFGIFALFQPSNWKKTIRIMFVIVLGLLIVFIISLVL